MTRSVTDACCASGPACERCRLWSRLWAERPALLAVARSRACSAEDAEDAVSEAILKAAECESLDQSRVGAWLNRVTQFHCADQARDRARAPKRLAYTTGLGLDTPGVDDAICERGHASWVAEQVERLPERQQRVLELRAQGHSIDVIALRLGDSYKATESLLSRGRRQLRDAMAGGLAVLAGVLGWGRRSVVTSSAAVATTAVAAVMLLPSVDQAQPADQVVRPARPLSAGTADATAPPHEATVRSEPLVAEARLQPLRPVHTLPPSQASPLAPEQRRVVVEEDQLGRVAVDHTRHDADESIASTLERCLREGPVVTTEVIGCPPADEPVSP